MNQGWLLSEEGQTALGLNPKNVGTAGGIIPLFKVGFFNPNGYAIYLLHYFDGFLDSDWNIPESQPRFYRTCLKIKPDPLNCQAHNGVPGAYSFSSSASNEISISYDTRDTLYGATASLVLSEGFKYHQVL